MKHIPNFLSIVRVFLIFPMVYCFLSPQEWQHLAVGCFVFACLTDGMDGYLARRYSVESKFGAFIDPVADKLLVSVSLILIVFSYVDILVLVPAIIIISREIVISALREWMALEALSSKVSVSWLGKFKTTFQMLAIVILMTVPDGFVLTFGIYLLWLSAAITILSMSQYIIHAIVSIQEKQLKRLN